jgi:Fic family protein
MSPFRHYDLKLVAPSFRDPLARTVLNLEYLRRWRLAGTTPPPTFFDLKFVFQFLENLRSARIEGNQTTVQELVDSRIDPPERKPEGLLEIENMDRAMDFIESAVQPSAGISQGIILEVHRRVVEGLTREGDPTPARFRAMNLRISGSAHEPPDYTQIGSYMDELLAFYQEAHGSQFDLIKVAMVHHRFAWIHPFRNGNGRTARLLTYATLIERGFDVRQGRILSPSAMIGNDRNEYYRHLAGADTGDDQGILDWCQFLLSGLLEDMQRIDRLLDYEYLSERILRPAVRYCRERGIISPVDASILDVAVDRPEFRSADLAGILKRPVARSRAIAALRRRNLVEPVSPHARRYRMRYSSSVLLRGVIDSLVREGFIGANE